MLFLISLVCCFQSYKGQAQITYLLNDAELLTSPPSTVLPCGNSPCLSAVQDRIIVFQEQSERTLTSTVVMDATAEMVLQNESFSPTPLNAGSCINSFLLVFNPSNNPSAGVFTASGTVRFSNPVIGFIFDSKPAASSNLYATNVSLGANGTYYPQSADFSENYADGIGYELVAGPTGNTDSINFIDEYTLEINMTASYPGDQLRIFTACCGCN